MEPTFNAQEVHNRGFGQVTFGSDEKLIVWFYDKPLQNGAKSKEANRPIFDNVAHVHIQQPGERDCFEQPASAEHRMRFPRQWAAYEAKQKAVMDGTPLSVLFPTNAALVENFRHINILTVEHLAGLNDTAIQNIGLGGREFVEKAKHFLSAHESSKGFNELSAKVDALQNSLAGKDERIAALETALAAHEEKRGPGRPRKEATAQGD